MAIKSIKRKYASRGAGGDLEGHRTYKEIWVVVTDGVNVTSVVISNDPRLPKKFSPFGGSTSPTDAGALCIKQDFDEMDGGVWLVTCHYDSRPGQGGNPERDTSDQLAWPPRYAIGTAPYQKVLHKDLEGTPFVNSAFQPLDDQAATVDDGRVILSMDRVEAANPIAKARAYKNAVNTDAVTLDGETFAIGTLYLPAITGSDDWQNGVHYWDVHYEFHVDEDGWIRKSLDKGTYYYDGGIQHPGEDKSRTFFNDEDTSVEGFLDATGDKLGDGDPIAELNFVVLKKKAFAPLELS